MRAAAVLLLVPTLLGCAASKPVLYPNAHLARVGPGQAEGGAGRPSARRAERSGAARGRGQP